jgi:dihydroorotase
MNPPLRGIEDVNALETALADATIDMIATDHAPHDPESKNAALLKGCFPCDPVARDCRLAPTQARAMTVAANGVIGLETALGLALSLVHRAVITPSRMVELMALNPARLMRLTQAGTLARGAMADLTIIDPELRWTVESAKLLSKSRNTPFAGMTLKGKATMTVVGGEIVYQAAQESK